MRRILAALLLVAILGGMLSTEMRPAEAQGVTCVEMGGVFPSGTGWTGIIGSPEYIWQQGITVVSGVSTWDGAYKEAGASYDFIAALTPPRAVRLHSVSYAWIYSHAGQTYEGSNPATASVATYYGDVRNTPIEVRSFTAMPTAAMTWREETAYFWSATSVDLVRFQFRFSPYSTRYLGFTVRQICYAGAPTPTPLPSRTPSITPTASQTRTPTTTLTPTETYTSTPITHTPTHTPEGTWYTSTPQIPDIGRGTAFSTLRRPEGRECTDPWAPCEINPPLSFPTIVFRTFTPGPGYATLTPIPTYTLAGDDPNRTPLPLEGLATQVAMLGGGETGWLPTPGLERPDREGIVDVYNTGHEIGSSIGSVFAFARLLQGVDLGRVGTVISFLLLLIGFNITVRIVLFMIPIIMALLRIVLLILQTIGALINAILPF